MALACLDLTTPDAVEAILAAVEKYKGWQVTRKPAEDCAWVWAPKRHGSRPHQVVVLSGEPARARSLTDWLRQRRWPVDKWLRGDARVPATNLNFPPPKPYPPRWPSDPSLWTLDPHAFTRIVERSVHVYEALACVVDPDRTEPHPEPDRRYAYRGDLKVVYVPAKRLIVTVMTLQAHPRQPMVPPRHLLVPDVIGLTATAPPALPKVSTPDTPAQEKPLPHKGNRDPKTGLTTTDAMENFIAERIAASRTDVRLLYFVRSDWMTYAQKACPASGDGALGQVLSSAKTKGWITLGGLQGATKWSIHPDRVKEWERQHADVVASENPDRAQVEVPAAVEPVKDEPLISEADVIAETVTPVPAPSAVRALTERAHIPGLPKSLIPHQAAPSDPIEVVSEAEAIAEVLAPPKPRTVRASSGPVSWIEVLPGTPEPVTVFTAAADVIDSERGRLTVKPGTPLIIDRVKRDPGDTVQYTVRVSPDGTEYWLIAWQEDEGPRRLS